MHHTPLEVALEIAPVYGEVSQTSSAANSRSESNSSVNPVQPVGTVIPLKIDGPKKLDHVDIPLLVEVSGDVRTANGVRVSAKITFTPLAGDSERIQKPKLISTTTYTQNEDEEETAYLDSEGRPSDFIAHVLQNEEYEVFVQPIKDTATDIAFELPPYVVNQFRATESTITRLDIDYGNVDIQKRSYEMTLSDIRDNLWLELYAVSSQQTDRVLSSRPTISAKTGTNNFDLGFISTDTPYQLIIKPVDNPISEDEGQAVGGSEMARTAIFPVFSIDGMNLETQIEQVSSTSSDNNDVRSFRIPSPQQKIDLSGAIQLCEKQTSDSSNTQRSDNSDSGSATDLPVTLYSTELFVGDQARTSSGVFTSQTTAKYNADSKNFTFSTQVFPGKYEIVVSPPTESACGILAKEMLIDAKTEGELQLTMHPVAYIEGKLQTSNGDPVFGATIQAQALGRDGIDESDNPTVTRFNRSSQSTTTEDGQFKLPVDLGSYDIIAKPPAVSSFGWKVLHDVKIGTRNSEFYREIILDAPVPIEGTLAYAVAEDSLKPATGLEGAEVRIFAVIDDIEIDNSRKRTVAIGRATADEMGIFKLLISPSLQQGWF